MFFPALSSPNLTGLQSYDARGNRHGKADLFLRHGYYLAVFIGLQGAAQCELRQLESWDDPNHAPIGRPSFELEAINKLASVAFGKALRLKGFQFVRCEHRVAVPERDKFV